MDTVAAVTATRNSGWDVTMVAGSPAQTPIVSQAPGKVTEGLYVMAQVQSAYEDSEPGSGRPMGQGDRHAAVQLARQVLRTSNLPAN